MPAERSSPLHANCNDVGMQTRGQFNEHCGFWGCTPHLTFVHPFNKCALVYFVMSMIRKHSASCFTRNLRANSFLTWTDERVTGRFWIGLFFVRCYACTWQRGKRLAVVNTSLHQPTSLWKRLLLWCWATGIRKGKNLFVTAHVAADRLSLVYKQPMWSEAFFMAKNGIWIFLAGINLDHNSMAIEMYFCQINNCHFFPISVLIWGRLPGVPDTTWCQSTTLSAIKPFFLIEYRTGQGKNCVCCPTFNKCKSLSDARKLVIFAVHNANCSP